MARPQRRYTLDDYFTVEAMSEIKHEFHKGEIFAMAGGTPEHAALSAEIITIIRPQLPDGCRAMTSDVRVRIESSDLCTYPDATVVCGKVERDRLDQNAIINPSVVIEVTSPSSEDYDRGEKLSHYRQIPSLQTIIIVSHKTKRLSVFKRFGNTWTASEFRSSEVATCEDPPLQIDVDALYRVLDGF